MTVFVQNSKTQSTCRHLVVDMSDCYTWSFPEFIPFCNHLYDFSSFKLYTIS
ncbi:MAG TPA: hypothetical protein VGD33_05720 [Chitinophagaceae bacterium]